MVSCKVGVIALLAGGIGGISPDLAYAPSILTNGKVPWYTFLHSGWIALLVVGLALACFRGLDSTLVLRRKKKWT